MFRIALTLAIVWGALAAAWLAGVPTPEFTPATVGTAVLGGAIIMAIIETFPGRQD